MYRPVSRNIMTLEIGSRLGHDDVTALIDEGGMGQVYRARDTKLGRKALKVLPQASAGDPDRFGRFERSRSAGLTEPPQHRRDCGP